MKYKISTYVLLVVLAGFVIYSCSQQKEEAGSQNLVQIQNVLQLSDSLAEELKAAAGRLDRKSGELILASQAKGKLRNYQTVMGIGCTPQDPHVIYGYSFGMEKFLTFADSVKRLDSIHQQKLKGVRAYLCLSQKNVTGPPQFFMDIFLAPIGEDGNDFYHIDDCVSPDKATRGDGGTVLNTSVPCPNQCQ